MQLQQLPKEQEIVTDHPQLKPTTVHPQEVMALQHLHLMGPQLLTSLQAPTMALPPMTTAVLLRMTSQTTAPHPLNPTVPLQHRITVLLQMITTVPLRPLSVTTQQPLDGQGDKEMERLHLDAEANKNGRSKILLLQSLFIVYTLPFFLSNKIITLLIVYSSS